MLFSPSEAGSIFEDVCGLVLKISVINLGQRWITEGVLVQREKRFVEQEPSAVGSLHWLYWDCFYGGNWGEHPL